MGAKSENFSSQEIEIRSVLPRYWKRSIKHLEEPKSLVIVPGADHFFFSHAYLLTQHLREFFKKYLGFKDSRVHGSSV